MVDFILFAISLGLFVLSVRYVILCPTRSSRPRISKSTQSSKGRNGHEPRWQD